MSLLLLFDHYAMIAHDNTTTPLAISIIDINVLKAGENWVFTLTAGLDELDSYCVCKLLFSAKQNPRSASCLITEWYASSPWQKVPTRAPYL